MPQMKHPRSKQTIEVADAQVRLYRQQGWRILADLAEVQVPDPNPDAGQSPTGLVEVTHHDGGNTPPAGPNPDGQTQDPADAGDGPKE